MFLTKLQYQEIVAEIQTDLKLNAGLVLNSYQIKNLKNSQQIIFSPNDLKNNLEAIMDYLHVTPSDGRVWNCYQDLSDDSIILVIELH